MASNAELTRRLGSLETRVDSIDQHGTRGIEGLRTQMTEQAKDIGKMEAQQDGILKRLDTLASQRTARLWAGVLAMIPVYVLLFLAVFTHP